MSKEYHLVKKNVASLWREQKTLIVMFNGKPHSLKCVLDERKQKYFVIEAYNYAVHERLFNKSMKVLTKKYKNREKVHDAYSLRKLGEKYLLNALKIRDILQTKEISHKSEVNSLLRFDNMR